MRSLECKFVKFWIDKSKHLIFPQFKQFAKKYRYLYLNDAEVKRL